MKICDSHDAVNTDLAVISADSVDISRWDMSSECFLLLPAVMCSCSDMFTVMLSCQLRAVGLFPPPQPTPDILTGLQLLEGGVSQQLIVRWSYAAVVF